MADDEDINRWVLDFSETFYAANDHFLCTNIAALGVSRLVVGWMKRYLANHTYQVRIGGAISKEVTVSSGVPQGIVIDYHHLHAVLIPNMESLPEELREKSWFSTLDLFSDYC